MINSDKLYKKCLFGLYVYTVHCKVQCTVYSTLQIFSYNVLVRGCEPIKSLRDLNELFHFLYILYRQYFYLPVNQGQEINGTFTQIYRLELIHFMAAK